MRAEVESMKVIRIDVVGEEHAGWAEIGEGTPAVMSVKGVFVRLGSAAHEGASPRGMRALPGVEAMDWLPGFLRELAEDLER
jgi:hypothetical protein